MGYKICLDIFEGPLDLLLYFIKKDELNIYDIPITRITEQYLEYLSLMEQLDLDIAGEFLVMAATLMHIKSKMLLPPDPDGTETEELDPRAELVRRLLEYKAFKEAAERLRGFEEQRGLLFGRCGTEPEVEPGGEDGFENVSLFDLLTALSKILKSIAPEKIHEVQKDEYTVSDKIRDIKSRLTMKPVFYFQDLFRNARNKFEVITTFLALLELIRQREVSIDQPSRFSDIRIERRNGLPSTALTNSEESSGS